MASRLTITTNNATSVWGGDVLSQIDWAQPWFKPWAQIGQPIAKEATNQKSVAKALNALSAFVPNQHPAVQQGHGAGSADFASEASMRPNSAMPLLNGASEASMSPNSPFPSLNGANGVSEAIAEQQHPNIQFVNQAELPTGQAYEDFIFKQGKVPTRDGLHDFFNGLCWHRFPKSKRRLNQLQAHEIAQQGIGSTRGPVRDALTLFDENVVLWQGPDALWQALQARDWLGLFVTCRDQWQHVHIVLFGHALLEKLVMPYKSITGHVYRVSHEVQARNDAALDTWLAGDLQARKLATKPYEPLPVLGVPGWWTDNAQQAFYEDAQVFRPRRVKNANA